MTDNASDTPKAGKGQGQAMWGGRFSAKPAELMQAINVSIGFDKRLWAQDLAGSRAHARMLISQGVIASSDGEEILEGLAKIEDEIATGTFPFRDEYEDIHMNIEARLRELIGPTAAGCTRPARATTRWPSTSAFGCATPPTARWVSWKRCKRPCWPRPRFTPTP